MTTANNFPKKWSIFTITSKKSAMVNFQLDKIDYHNFDYYGAFTCRYIPPELLTRVRTSRARLQGHLRERSATPAVGA